MANQLEQSTLRPRAPLEAPQSRELALTVLFHPDLSRVGDVAAVGDGRSLSRLAPPFAAPGAAEGRPLTSPWLSRQPIRVAPLAGGGAELLVTRKASALRVDGAPVDASVRLAAERVAAGVVLTLADRVVLLLHPASTLPHGPDLGLLGASEGIRQVRERVLRLAPSSSSPVLVLGETGTGKELVARAITASGRRAGAPFLAVNAAAIPGAVAAAELFGHARGAFTGAAASRDGYFAAADGGTLFLDEVGELSVEVQAMLLRVLESGEIQPVGGTPRRVDVRVIAATDADLEAACAAGRFRQALYQRLAGVRVHLPPLRARREDIGRLFEHFLRHEVADAGQGALLAALADERPWLPTEAIERMALHPWPGNVRQLRGVVRGLVAAARLDRPLSEAELTPLLGAAPDAQRPQAGGRAPVTDDALVAALRAHHWSPTAAARQLGVSRTTLYALIDASEAIRKARDVGRAELEQCLASCDGDVAAAAARLEVSERGLRLRMGELGLG